MTVHHARQRSLDELVAVALSLLTLVGSLAQAKQPLSIPTDPSAKYVILEIKRLRNEMVEVTTQRIGKSGTTFSKRLVDCHNLLFKYLGSGSTIEEMKSSRSDDEMALLTAGSISTYISTYACKNVR